MLSDMDSGWYQGESSIPLANLVLDHEAAFDLEKGKGLLGSSLLVDLCRGDCIRGLNMRRSDTISGWKLTFI